MKAIDHNNYEEWLFEYFEGSLSKEKKNEILNFIQGDPMLQEEFSYWEKTYIREPLPSKLKIEEALLKKVRGNDYVKYIVLTALVLFGGVAYYLYNLKSTASVTQNIFTKEIKKLTPPEKIGNPKKINVELKAGKEKGTFKKSRLENLKPEISFDVLGIPDAELKQDTVYSTKAVPDIIVKSTTSYPNVPDSMNEKKSSIISSANNLKKASSKESRKMHRLIEKHKRRERVRREADEFIKGNTPYVVPLDPNAF